MLIIHVAIVSRRRYIRGMEIGIETTPRVTAKSAQRSRVSNGRLLPITDLRSATARRFKDLVHDIAADLGGMDHISTGELQLVRRASMLSAECERQEALAAQEDIQFDCDGYVVKTNALRRVLETIGLKRRPRPVNDGSAILSDYFSRPPPKEGAAP